MDGGTEAPSFWPDCVEFTGDLTPASWIAPRMMPWGHGLGTPAGSVVPTGYPAYVRVLHPDGKRGQMADSLRRALVAHLTSETTTPYSVFFAIWEGWGELHRQSSSESTFVGTPGTRTWQQISMKPFQRMVEGRATFSLPGRAYLLAHGTLDDLPRIPRGRLTPSLMWPEDQAFCCGTEIDLDSTILGLSKRGARRILDDGTLKALLIDIEHRLDVDGDPLNPGLRRRPQPRQAADQS